MNIICEFKNKNQTCPGCNCVVKNKNCNYIDYINYLEKFYLFQINPSSIVKLVHKINFEVLLKLMTEVNTKLNQIITIKLKSKKINKTHYLNKTKKSRKQVLEIQSDKILQFDDLILLKNKSNQNVFISNV